MSARDLPHPAVLPAAADSTWRETLLSALLCAVLGAFLIYGAGFAGNMRLHNAAHDARHAAGFPCN